MSRKTLALTLAFSLVASFAGAADSPRFRGPNSDGIFAETGLMKSWPKDGPKRLWMVTGLGESYASVTVVDGKLYTTGMTEQKGTAFAFDTQGKALWKTEYGAEHNGSGYPGTRTTPTVAGDHLYLLSSMGKAVALEAKTGAKAWEVDLFGRFKGENIYFGVSESPLVVDGKVIYTPGGKGAAVVALDAKTGDTVWTSKGLDDPAAYCNPVLFDNGKHRQIVTLVSKHLVGLDPATGEVLWTTPNEATYDIHSTSPAIEGSTIYVSHGYDQGGMLYELAADGKSVNRKWTEEKLDIHHGGAVRVDGHIYGAASKKTWYVLDAANGEILASIPRLGKGAVVYADGLLYGYTERGEVVLVDPDPKNFKVISRFKVTEGSGHHWSHPVISHGVLYVRHGEVLMAYDVKQSS
ncbi:MAG: PQQ-binding-like beta-propeller repeat protein [Acidobacteriota bacterium]